jgi:transglutaminase-like putative cysteine protease
MLIRFLRWIIRKIGLKTIFILSLLLIAVSSVAYGISDAIRGLESGILFRLVILGILGSWFLAGRRIHTWIGVILLLVTGFVYLIICLGQLTGPLFALFKATDYIIWEYINRTPDIPIDLTNFNLAYSEVYYGVTGVLMSFREWFITITQGLPFYDEIAITLVWGGVTWMAASWSGWILRRHNQPLISVLPAGILLTTILSYTWSGTASLVPMLSSTLLLMALINYAVSEEGWSSTSMDYPEDLPREFGLTVSVIVIGIVTLATILPTISISKIVEYVQQFTKPQIEEAEPVFQSFGLEQSSVPREDIGKALRGGFPRGHLIGSGPELAEKVVMTVNISAGIPKQIEREINLPLYWRSLTYDDYFGFGWRSSDIILRYYKDGESALFAESPYHRLIQQDFRMAKGETLFLYAAGEILSADDDYKIAYRPTPRYTEVFDAPGDFFGASIDQTSYRVQSLIPAITENDLRSAQGEYPGWILERYLQLPDSIPSRVFKLAEDITRNDMTEYDKARSLERYLRGFDYSLDVEMPPLNQDMVDYFLFDLQQGYCDYYATSMVVMARGLGIPTRIAVGYYRGTYDDVNRRFVVTEADAHSWVEVYFPGIGWIPFEPTAGREEIERLTPIIDVPEDLDTVKPFRSTTWWFKQWNWNWTSVSLVIILGLAIIIITISTIDNLLILSYSPNKAVTRLYLRLFRHSRRLGAPAQRWTTPYEFSQSVKKRISTLFKGSLFESTLYPAISEIEDFTSIYTLMLYSPKDLTIRDRNKVISIWRQLRRRLWIAWLRQIVYREEKKP